MSQMLWAGFAVSIVGAAVSVLTMAGRRTDARRDEAGSVHEPDSVA